MKGMTAFACLSDIDLDLIEESTALLGLAPTAKTAAGARPKGFTSLSRFLSSGIGVAVICTLVSATVLSAIIWAGRLVPEGPPTPGTAETDTAPRPTEPESESDPAETPAPETQAPSSDTVTEAPETEAPKKGCGSSVAIGSAVLLSAMAAAVALKKKD